jgi:hypothetical protein
MPLIADTEGIGYAVRYGIVVEPTRTALDEIADTDAYRALARKGYAAEHADTDHRAAEMG